MLDAMAHLLGVKVQTIVAAILGALTSLLFNRGAQLARRAGLVAGGVCVAFYTADPAVAWVGLPDRYVSPVGFLIGLFGIQIVEAVMRAIGQADLWSVLRDWISRRPK